MNVRFQETSPMDIPNDRIYQLSSEIVMEVNPLLTDDITRPHAYRILAIRLERVLNDLIPETSLQSSSFNILPDGISRSRSPQIRSRVQTPGQRHALSKAKIQKMVQ